MEESRGGENSHSPQSPGEPALYLGKTKPLSFESLGLFHRFLLYTDKAYLTSPNNNTTLDGVPTDSVKAGEGRIGVVLTVSCFPLTVSSEICTKMQTNCFLVKEEGNLNYRGVSL